MQAVIPHENHERNRSITKPMIHVCFSDMGVSENRLNPEKPNGFADHYPV